MKSIFTVFILCSLWFNLENLAALPLYPPITPYTSGMLQVDETHILYWEESGNPDGVPILFLHGGPGAATNASHRQLFDPSYYRIILFDQRGCGKSTPLGSLEDNTTWHLVTDINALLELLSIDRCVLCGGSWGTTLALAYAIEHPEKVSGMILRGIFLCQQEELDWFYQDGASSYSPEAWEILLNAIPEDNRDHLISAYHELFQSPNDWERTNAAAAWILWEFANLEYPPDARLQILLDYPFCFGLFSFLYASQNEVQAKIENHYFYHQGFLPTDSWIIEQADRFNEIPGIIIQGENDRICPWKYAATLHDKWPQSSLVLIPMAGHSGKIIS